MLDLTILTKKLTQGQPPAEMTLATQRQAETGATPPPPGSQAVPMSGTPASAFDPEIVARRVYDLMREELAVERGRRGRWR